MAAANGKMMSHSLSKSSFLRLPNPVGRPLWDIVLDAAVDQGVDALVDVGALLAGRPLREVALELTRRQVWCFSTTVPTNQVGCC